MREDLSSAEPCVAPSPTVHLYMKPRSRWSCVPHHLLDAGVAHGRQSRSLFDVLKSEKTWEDWLRTRKNWAEDHRRRRSSGTMRS